MALDGDRLAVGSPGQDVGGLQDIGTVRVYERAGAAWRQTAQLTAPDARKGDSFGGAIALDGPLLAIAAPGRLVNQVEGGGAVFVYRETGGTWVYEATLRPDDLGYLDSYAFAIAASGDRVAVSAAGRERTRGSVFIYVRQPSGAWELEGEVWPTGRGRETGFGEDVALDGDRLLAGAIGVGGFRGAVYEFHRGPEGWRQVLD